jgi:hypothetical protein
MSEMRRRAGGNFDRQDFGKLAALKETCVKVDGRLTYLVQISCPVIRLSLWKKRSDIGVPSSIFFARK